jgi:hypothetical protein
MIRTDYGMNKADGVCYCIDAALPVVRNLAPRWGESIEDATRDLMGVPGLGPFLAYEVTTDLRHTPVLRAANDIMTWANAGPGCTHGLGRMFDDAWKWKRGDKSHQREMVEVMQEILRLSQDPVYWPQDWTPWEIREAEHWACEYDKHCRGTEGASLKRRYRE